MRKVITVDGPAGSGKTTIAKLLANRINFSYLDTGSIYRTITLQMVRNNIDPREISKIKDILKETNISVDEDKFFLNDKDVTSLLREEKVNNLVPAFAQNKNIREFIRKKQQKIANNGYYIVDGRDIGTVIFKDAFCKFYLDASANVRANRRLKDLKENTSDKTQKDILQEIMKRDEQDKNRSESPLKIPVDALVIDSSNLATNEVISKMIDYYNEKIIALEEESDEEGYSQSNSEIFLEAMNNMEIPDKIYKPGTITKANIIEINDQTILLGLEGKRDGMIQGKEVLEIKNQIKVGEEINVFVLNSSNFSEILLSKLEADKREGLSDLQKIHEEQTKLTGKILEKIKGGYKVDVLGNIGFCPFSEFNLFKKSGEEVVGTTDYFYTIQVEENNILLSRKKHLEEQREIQIKEFLDNNKEGDVIDVIVVSIIQSGVLVNIKESVTGIVRFNQLTWSRYEKVTDIVNVGDKIKVKIISIDSENRRFELSKKVLDADPFSEYVSTHQVDDIVIGRVKNFQSFGVFIELDRGVEGLLHVSEMSWTKRIDSPEELFKKDDKIKIKILSIDKESRRISLGLKQIEENPWNVIDQKYTVNDLVKATVKSIGKQKVYCLIDNEYEGVLKISDISWVLKEEKINLNNLFSVGKEETMKVLGHDTKKKHILLGLKQKTDNPWEDIKANHPVGTAIFNEVTKIIDSGCFVKIDNDIDGFCHISNLSDKKIEKVEDVVEIGKSYNFLVTSINEANKRLSLSIKDYLKYEEKKDIEKYLGQETQETMTLGELVE